MGKNKDGDLFVAAFSFTFVLGSLLVLGIWQLAAWLFAKPTYLVVIAIAVATSGCSEFRATGEVSTLVHRVAFCMEVVK